jgi:hypothetical protein
MASENTVNIFELASKQKLRFDSNKGPLTVEQLWELPLTSRDNFNLDAVAQLANAGLQAASAESFVATKINPAKASYELKLELVKYVIADKIAAAQKAEARQAKTDERRKLYALLDEKKDAEMGALSKEEILKRLAAIDEE